MSKGDILVVDDDAEVRTSLTHLLERGGYEVSVVSDGQKALAALETSQPDVVLCDVRMPGMDGLEFQTKAASVTRAPVVLFSAHADIPMAVEAIQNGAYNFLEKPFDPRRLLRLLENAVRMKQLRDTAARLEERLTSVTNLEQVLIGGSARIRTIRRTIFDYAGAQANVLVFGSTGTGKELVARALHDLGPGPGAPFVAVNCAVIPPERFEETVFGSAVGAAGFMQRADGGTLFLDELTSMPIDTQAKFLRAVETRLCEPVGGSKAVEVDLRVISAMSEEPDAAVGSGSLRKDLLFRLNTLMIELPSLAERGDDVFLLFRHYLHRLSALYDIEAPELSNADVSALLAHDWPGNVRELQNVAERRVLAAKRGGGSVGEAIRGDADPGQMPATLREAVAAFEREIIGKALQAHGGRMDDAAEALGIGRRTLNEKIVKLGVDKTRLLGVE